MMQLAMSDCKMHNSPQVLVVSGLGERADRPISGQLVSDTVYEQFAPSVSKCGFVHKFNFQ